VSDRDDIDRVRAVLRAAFVGEMSRRLLRALRAAPADEDGLSDRLLHSATPRDVVDAALRARGYRPPEDGARWVSHELPGFHADPAVAVLERPLNPQLTGQPAGDGSTHD
jgi:hypothetical protein